MSKPINAIEQRYLPMPVEIRAEGEKRTVSGYAAVFEQLSQNLGWFREKIARGAFDNVLDNDVVALFNHDSNHVLARTISKTLQLSVDDTGLRYEFEAPNTTSGNDLIEMLKRGDVQHSSFSFSIEDQKWEQDDELGEIRTVLKVKRLYDVSPVVMPAYKQTDVSVAKRSYDEFKEQQKPAYNDIDILQEELNLLSKFN
jgi:HK97 family phage prohead protease